MPAKAVITGETVVVSSSAVPQPMAVRYSWEQVPKVTLFNSDGLPASPFCSDDWVLRSDWDKRKKGN